MNDGLFYISDLNVLREKLTRAEQENTALGQAWAGVRRRAQKAPDRFPWFAPFAAVVTGREEDFESARNAIRNYVGSLEARQFTAGVQFHFWCYAFPHARWALYFHWLRALGAWDPAEAIRLRDAFVSFQFSYFFAGMRVKPEPECVDNQTLSLCYSNALIGHLFSNDEDAGDIARRMRDEGARRLPHLIGGMPPGGYSGEGSTYMDVVMGPAIPFVVEWLERVQGGDWFNKPLPPNGGSAAAVARMIAREWMPSGLLLPWDHYGYTLPLRSCLSYAARRTGNARYIELLERHADWSFDIGAGWGVDDMVWTLVWWPETRPAEPGPAFESWAAPEIGAALVCDDDSLYLLQMWDESAPKKPVRMHVNPNAVLLSAYGSPLSIDGVASPECHAFEYDDTWDEWNGVSFETVRVNYGVGCGGAHSVLLVDDWEGMRAMEEYEQARMISFDATNREVIADVTPLYRERNPDTRCVRRKSRLCANRFWLIEDLAVFEKAHALTARWWLRPERVAAHEGILLETPEGVRLWFVPVLGPGDVTVERVGGYAKGFCDAALRADFRQHGSECRWLWFVWPEQTREIFEDIPDKWQAFPDPGETLDIAEIAGRMNGAAEIPFTMPAFLLADQPVVRRWWYRREITTPESQWWLRLPRGMSEARLWINGEEVDLTPYRTSMALLAPQIAMPRESAGKRVEIVVRTDTGASQEEGRDRQGAGFWGSPAIMTPLTAAKLPEVDYKDGVVTVRSGSDSCHVPHTLMKEEA